MTREKVTSRTVPYLLRTIMYQVQSPKTLQLSPSRRESLYGCVLLPAGNSIQLHCKHNGCYIQANVCKVRSVNWFLSLCFSLIRLMTFLLSICKALREPKSLADAHPPRSRVFEAELGCFRNPTRWTTCCKCAFPFSLNIKSPTSSAYCKQLDVMRLELHS